jgi:anti-sigma regulatory factor (Ser/Thr protein kinase)
MRDGTLVYHRCLTALPGNVARLRRELDMRLAGAGMPADRRAEVALVLSEAVTNAVLHAYHGADAGPVEVVATFHGEELELTVADRGRGMSPPGPSRGAGLGMSLMTRLADRVGVEGCGAGPGMRVRLAFGSAFDPGAAATGRAGAAPRS